METVLVDKFLWSFFFAHGSREANRWCLCQKPSDATLEGNFRAALAVRAVRAAQGLLFLLQSEAPGPANGQDSPPQGTTGKAILLLGQKTYGKSAEKRGWAGG